jgi:hypothetical protein
MPHVSDVRVTSHDRHDPMLVAALAADDLAGTDRDQAIALTRGCADCATLHEDLRALARATASAPPPIATRPRDFRLTPADAAHLRPSGWRRLVAAASSSRTIFSRPLGAGLATIGLVGLLIGNVQLGGNSAGAAGAPSAAQSVTSAAGPAAAASSSNRELSGLAVPSGSSGDSSVGLFPAAAPGPSMAAASAAPTRAGAAFGSAASSGLPDEIRANPLGVVPGKAAASQPATGDASALNESLGNEPLRPLNLLFGAAVIVGIGLLVGSFIRNRRAV